jgi:DNA invertase Pin-like site-specific DNA recombinase
MSTATLPRRRNVAAVLAEPYAISYDRLSRVRSSENAPEVAVGNIRQDEDNVAAAVAYGGVRERFTDKGSASRFRTKERDDFPRLLAEIRTGRPTHVLIWVLDRIIRDDKDRVELIDACRANGVLIVQSGTGTVIDPNDPDSVFLATILGAVAVLEIEKMSKRILRFKEARREAGMPPGGWRWFGYEDGNMTPHESEAAVFRDLVGRFLGGEALHALARSLTDAGVTTANGAQWTGPNLRQTLIHPRYAGLLVHKGEVVGPGAWAPLIDEATHESVKQKLNNPDRRTNKGSNARKYLLTGLGVCATCGAVLRGRILHEETVVADERYGDRAYACATNRHVHKSMRYVDSVVEALIVERLKNSDMTGALVDNSAADEARALREDRDAVQASIAELDDELEAGELTAKAYARATTRLEKKLDELDELVTAASARATAPVAILDGMVGEHAQAAWDAADLGRRRELVKLLTTRVALRGGGRGGKRRFDPRCVEVDWR